MFMDDQRIHDFLVTQLHMVIATVGSNNMPQAALVGFAHRQDLTLIFATSTTSRKYTNMKNNPHVAIVFGSNEGITVQYEGTVSEFTLDELKLYKQVYFLKTPSSQKYE